MITSKSPVIFSHFDDLTDPRMDRTKCHLLIDMVVIALCAAICGAEGWADVERFGSALTDHGVRLDGKTLRHSFDTASGKDALQLLNAWSSDLQVCLGQVAVDKDSNEITAVPKLLELLELTGAVVTLDAMHCQNAKRRPRRQSVTRAPITC